MNKHELCDYSKWIDKSALEIRDHVIKVGGWTTVFPGELPKWTHRLRNFFNEPPRAIYRVHKAEGKRIIAETAMNSIWRIIAAESGTYDKVYEWVVTEGASSGDVYREWYRTPDGQTAARYWIEQSQTGSTYHSKEGYGPLKSALYPHNMTGNFKLCSGDGTGGSSEWCLHNWMHGVTKRWGKNSKVNEGEWVNAATQGITDPEYRGSYNFADTMIRGYYNHVRLDVDPDNKWGAKYDLTGLSSRGVEWIPLRDRIFRKDFSFV